MNRVFEGIGFIGDEVRLVFILFRRLRSYEKQALYWICKYGIKNYFFLS